MFLNNHLRHTLSTQRLTALKLLSSEGCQSVKYGSNQQHNGGSDQTRGFGDDAEPLDEGHDGVDGGAHVVGCEPADEGVEFGGCRADSEEEGDFDEEDDEGGYAGGNTVNQ